MSGLTEYARAIFNNDREYFYKLKQELECEEHEEYIKDGWCYCIHCGKDLGIAASTDWDEYRRTETEALKNNN